jgi:enoyl-CoA hydratase/carnithine racemase
MFDALLHMGIEHADFTKPIVTALFGFVAGTGVGLSATRLSAIVRTLSKAAE